MTKPLEPVRDALAALSLREDAAKKGRVEARAYEHLAVGEVTRNNGQQAHTIQAAALPESQRVPRAFIDECGVQSRYGWIGYYNDVPVGCLLARSRPQDGAGAPAAAKKRDPVLDVAVLAVLPRFLRCGVAALLVDALVDQVVASPWVEQVIVHFPAAASVAQSLLNQRLEALRAKSPSISFEIERHSVGSSSVFSESSGSESAVEEWHMSIKRA